MVMEGVMSYKQTLRVIVRGLSVLSLYAPAEVWVFFGPLGALGEVVAIPTVYLWSSDSSGLGTYGS